MSNSDLFENKINVIFFGTSVNHKHGVCSIGNMTFNFSILFDDGDKISFNSSFGHLQDENI